MKEMGSHFLKSVTVILFGIQVQTVQLSICNFMIPVQLSK